MTVVKIRHLVTSRPATNHAPAVRGSACTTYAIRSPLFSSGRGFSLCRWRNGWATVRLPSLWMSTATRAGPRTPCLRHWLKPCSEGRTVLVR